MKFEITREIGIDAAHRVLLHSSKCKNIHGHRYTVQVTVAGGLQPTGEQSGMVMDFGFLKDLMMEHIDKPCDHGMILEVGDPIIGDVIPDTAECAHATKMAFQFGSWEMKGKWGKLYLLPFTPTAENLAYHWYCRLDERVKIRSNGNAQIHKVRVWETPNSFCDYPSQGLS